MIARIDEARSNGDTVGGVFEVVAHGLPIGLGSYVHWDRRLDAALAAAVMSINIVKGVEFGLGFEQTKRFGSAVHDVIEGRGEGGRWIHRSNNAGGLTGGITNGEPLVVRGAVKPISTLARPLPSADLVSGEAVDKAHYERSDISVVPAAGVVAEAMVMLTLADAMLDKFGGDTIADTRDALDRYVARISRAVDAPVAGGRRSLAGAPRRRRRRQPGRRRGRLRRRRLGRDRWTSSSSASRAAARAPSGGGSPIATARRSSTSTTRSRRRPARRSRRSSPSVARPASGRVRARGRRGPRPGRSGPPRSGRWSPRAAARSSTRATAGRCTAAASRSGSTSGPRSSPSASAARPNVRPLIVGRDPMGAIRDLARDRDRFYSAAHRMNGVAELRVDRRARSTSWSAGSRTPRADGAPPRPTRSAAIS